MSQTNIKNNIEEPQELQEHLLIRTVRELAAEKPDFVYPSSSGRCYYTPDQDQPGCIFGQALLKLGYTTEYLLTCDIPNSLGIISVLVELNIIKSFTEKEADWCRRVQGRQDSGLTWENAVKDADSGLNWGELKM